MFSGQRKNSRLLTSILLSAALGGCGSSGASSEQPPVEFGTSDEGGLRFVGLQDKEDVALWPGMQGGFHVWTHVQVSDWEGVANLQRKVRRKSDGAVVNGSSDYYLEIVSDNRGSWQMVSAIPTFMCPAPIGIDVFDQTMIFEFALSAEDGSMRVEKSFELTPRCPSGEIEMFCRQICSGD